MKATFSDRQSYKGVLRAPATLFIFRRISRRPIIQFRVVLSSTVSVESVRDAYFADCNNYHKWKIVRVRPNGGHDSPTNVLLFTTLGLQVQAIHSSLMMN